MKIKTISDLEQAEVIYHAFFSFNYAFSVVGIKEFIKKKDYGDKIRYAVVEHMYYIPRYGTIPEDGVKHIYMGYTTRKKEYILEGSYFTTREEAINDAIERVKEAMKNTNKKYMINFYNKAIKLMERILIKDIDKIGTTISIQIVRSGLKKFKK